MEDAHVDTVTLPGFARHDTFSLAVALMRMHASGVNVTAVKGLTMGQPKPFPPLTMMSASDGANGSAVAMHTTFVAGGPAVQPHGRLGT